MTTEIFLLPAILDRRLRVSPDGPVMIKNNYFTDNSDIQSHFNDMIPWTEIVGSYEGGFRDARTYRENKDEKLASAPGSVEEALDYYRTILESAGDLAGNEISPYVAALDREGLRIEKGLVKFPQKMIELVKTVRDAGLQPYGFSRKYGGLGLPWVVKGILSEIFYRVDGSMAIAIGCVNLAEILEHIASEEMKDEWLPRLTAGEFVCAMGLTEPDFGSDLPNIRTRAEKKSDGSWTLNGTKRFITHGCGFGEIPALILTLARSGSPGSGARGLSFFLVNSSDVQIAGIEHKLGLHCSPTCEIVLENSPGVLVGQEGLGLIRYTMGMLNGARLGIAFQSVGLASEAFYEAQKYASERIQFGRPISGIGAVKKMLRRMESEIAAMRCLIMEGCRAMDLYSWRPEHLKAAGGNEKDIKNDTIIRYWEKLANILTPLCKYYCAEMCLKITSDALQIHGGSGYTEDYDIARLYRDARIVTIYDGTSQIQVGAAIGGIVSGMSPTGNLREYIDCEIDKLSEKSSASELFSVFDRTVAAYRDMSSEKKEEFAEEAVIAAARMISTLLLFRSGDRIRASDREARKSLAQTYFLDSLGICEGNLVRMSRLSAP